VLLRLLLLMIMLLLIMLLRADVRSRDDDAKVLLVGLQ